MPGSWRLLMSHTLDSVGLEVEFTARHEDRVREEFALGWDSLPQIPGQPGWRYSHGVLRDGLVLFTVVGELVGERRVELVGFRAVRVSGVDDL